MKTMDILEGRNSTQTKITINLGDGITLEAPGNKTPCFEQTYANMMKPKELFKADRDILKKSKKIIL